MPNILENTLEANDDNEGGEREINLDEINFEKNDEKIFTINHQISHDLVANSRQISFVKSLNKTTNMKMMNNEEMEKQKSDQLDLEEL